MPAESHGSALHVGHGWCCPLTPPPSGEWNRRSGWQAMVWATNWQWADRMKFRRHRADQVDNRGAGDEVTNLERDSAAPNGANRVGCRWQLRRRPLYFLTFRAYNRARFLSWKPGVRASGFVAYLVARACWPPGGYAITSPVLATGGFRLPRQEPGASAHSASGPAGISHARQAG